MWRWRRRSNGCGLKVPLVGRADTIEAIGIDPAGSLWIKPGVTQFPLIYREAMEVQWDPDRLCLYGPRPREWSYLNWFAQIVEAARQQGVELKLNPDTLWSGIDEELRQSILTAT